MHRLPVGAMLPKKRHYRRHPATSVFTYNGDIVSGVVDGKPELDRHARALMTQKVRDIRGFNRIYVKCGQYDLFCRLQLSSSGGLLKPCILRESIIAGATSGHKSIASVFNTSASLLAYLA